MAERLHPGVYVEEVSSGVRPIEGAGTSTAAFVGSAARGMTSAQFVTSFDEYERRFGGHRPGEDGFLAAAVESFFSAGGRRAYVVRVLPAGAERGQSDPVPSRFVTSGAGGVPQSLRFEASGAGAWSDEIRVRIDASTHFPNEAFKLEVLRVDEGGAKTEETFDDLRMDPDAEDYVESVVNGTSKYIRVVDLFALERDAEAPSYAPIPEQSAGLSAAPPKAIQGLQDHGYTVYRNAELSVRAWDESLPDNAVTASIVFTDAALAAAAGGATFQLGKANVTAAQLSALLATALGSSFLVIPASGTTPPRIEAKFATRPYAVIAPPGTATTFNLDGGTLAIVIAGTSHEVFPPQTAADVPDATAITLAQMLTIVEKALPAGFSAEVRDRAIVVRGSRLDQAQTVAVNVSDPNVLVSIAVAGQAGTVAETLNTVQLTISEVRRPFVQTVLGQLGFAARAQGFEENSPQNPLALPAAASNVRLRGGSDGPANAVLSVADFRGSSDEHTGLHALDGIDVNLVALPGKNAPEFLTEVMSYVDGRGDCFGVLDGPGSLERDFQVTALEAKQVVEGLPNRSKNSAIYYPWPRMADPTGVGKSPTRFVPPSGVAAGIYARTDLNRGVWKAPAGIEAVVSGALGLQSLVLDADQDILNPFSVNCLRQFPGTGIVVWGARTLASDPEWRYVPVRRTALFLKESIRRGIQWAVFEPNDANLWSQIQTNIKSFMLAVFRQGAFQGATPDEAFRVRCDRSTNPQEQVDAGIVTATVAFAPLKPAEFVVIQISQKVLVS
jgi:uncharacterized protein